MTAACQIDFYVLQDRTASTESLACQLALMAWEHGNRVMVLAENEKQAEQVDTLMWENPKGRFLPHKQKRQAGFAPVIIVTLAELADDAGEVIINLTQDAVPRPQRFRRLLELVPADDAQRKASREKFRVYRTQGLKPESHPFKHN